MPVCIYCCREMGNGSFNRDHVVPEGLGTFEQNWVLHSTVCRGCNQYFGDNLELELGRDTAEGLFRYNAGVKAPEEIDKLLPRRLRITLNVPGPWQGVRVGIVNEGGSLAQEPLAQAVFETGTGWVSMTEQELADPTVPLPPNRIPKGRCRLFGPSQAAVDRVRKLVEDRGIPFKHEGDIPFPGQAGKEVEVEIHSEIDSIVKRSIAKIAFNYTAYTEGAEFVLQGDFDVTRRFIRHGLSPEYALVVADYKPILADDTIEHRQTIGHLITLNWTDDRNNIVAQVSPFNMIRYRVSLAREYRGERRDIRRGDVFDPVTHRISDLFRTSLHIPKMIIPGGKL